MLKFKAIIKIEAFDVSHLYQDHTVASWLFYTKREPIKISIGCLIFKNLAGNDSSLNMPFLNVPENKNTQPDMLLIDGEKQLKFVESLIKSSKYSDITVISIVKGVNRIRATETILSGNGVIEMDKFSKVICCSKIRDEPTGFNNCSKKKKNKR